MVLRLLDTSRHFKTFKLNKTKKSVTLKMKKSARIVKDLEKMKDKFELLRPHPYCCSLKIIHLITSGMGKTLQTASRCQDHKPMPAKMFQREKLSNSIIGTNRTI